MQSAELYSHPLRVLDVKAGLGAPPVLQTAPDAALGLYLSLRFAGDIDLHFHP
jgi:hypothetical protein